MQKTKYVCISQLLVGWTLSLACAATLNKSLTLFIYEDTNTSSNERATQELPHGHDVCCDEMVMVVI
jgi:hypothetical protein